MSNLFNEQMLSHAVLQVECVAVTLTVFCPAVLRSRPCFDTIGKDRNSVEFKTYTM